MRLADWRAEKGWSQQRLADALGCTVSTVWRYEQGLRDPEAAVKQRIFVLTEGKVQPNDFYDVPGWRRILASALSLIGKRAA